MKRKRELHKVHQLSSLWHFSKPDSSPSAPNWSQRLYLCVFWGVCARTCGVCCLSCDIDKWMTLNRACGCEKREEQDGGEDERRRGRAAGEKGKQEKKEKTAKVKKKERITDSTGNGMRTTLCLLLSPAFPFRITTTLISHSIIYSQQEKNNPLLINRIKTK